MRDGWDMMRWDSHRAPLEDALAFTRLLGYSNPSTDDSNRSQCGFQRETRRDQADEIIEYVLTLCLRASTWSLVGQRSTECNLHNYYGDILPSSVTNPCNDTRNDYSITTLVDVVGTDGLAVEILRTVGETESGHMAYSAPTIGVQSVR